MAWIYLNNAFLSIVDDPNNKKNLLVRARFTGDIARVFGKKIRVEKTPERDYLFRARIPRTIVARTLAAKIETIDYSNFKDSVENKSRHDTYLSVWSVMSRAQGGDNRWRFLYSNKEALLP